MRIGVLAMQGAFKEHLDVLKLMGAEALPLRLPAELDGLDGLIIPGGESTTISRLMTDYGLMQPVRGAVKSGLPVLGTCAGMVLLAQEVSDFDLETLGLMNINVRRNVFGSQVDSFEVDLEVPALGQQPFHAVFIRAPVIEKAGPKVEVLARLPNGTIVATRQGKMLAVAFHPELSGDPRFHRYFLDIINTVK